MLDVFKNPAAYRKFWVAVAGAVVVILGRHLGVQNEYYADVVTVLTALGVVATPNKQ